ncbi:hypothetical protein O7606_14120 [Micromonospora sp. WMMD882]|uniref:hypothetical protein n=1 Tax=Micromonospora sp. WMMD882 TaxID=3015151 RepID=UPI00248C7842|nr:hypothetical protein [Micromonospora sp. WMMD882]WBB77428.1 hypothetical protein O7606_14120 [Micromonospora sp. WMMD882]
MSAAVAGGDPAQELERAVASLVNQVGHWQAPRWAARASGDDLSRADLVHKLVQDVADLAADVEGQPRRPVPRLDNDLALPDQLRVVTTDLLLAAPTPPPPGPATPSAPARATAAVTTTQRAL